MIRNIVNEITGGSISCLVDSSGQFLSESEAIALAKENGRKNMSTYWKLDLNYRSNPK